MIPDIITPPRDGVVPVLAAFDLGAHAEIWRQNENDAPLLRVKNLDGYITPEGTFLVSFDGNPVACFVDLLADGIDPWLVHLSDGRVVVAHRTGFDVYLTAAGQARP